MRKSTFLRKQQSGAALVVSMILLIAITLMAVSSMGNASLDLIMAGNEQFHSRAFFAAEAALETSWKNDAAFTSSNDYPQTAAISMGSGSDAFQYGVVRPMGLLVGPPPSGSTMGTFGAVYWKIRGVGNSERNSQAVNLQELYETVRTDDGLTYRANTCLRTSNLDASVSAC